MRSLSTEAYQTARGGYRGGSRGVQGVATPTNHPEQSYSTASKAYYSFA